MHQTLTIAKKELRTFFHHPMGYVLSAVFLILNNFFFFRQAYIANEATVRPMFEFLPWLFLFFIPAMTMRTIAEEERRGTVEVILAQPLKVSQYIAGKLVGALILACILLSFTVAVPIGLSFAGSFDWGVVGAEYLGGLLLAATATSIGVLASSVSKNQVLALLGGFAMLFVLMFIGFETVLLAVPAYAASILGWAAIIPHLANIARGALDLRDVVYFLSLTAIFSFAAYTATSRRRQNPSSIRSKTIATYLASTVALSLLFMVAVSFWNVRLDLTSGKVYTLSDATKELVRNLTKEVTLTLFVSKNLPPQVASLHRDVRDLITDYVNASRGSLKAEVRYPDTDEAVKQDALASGVAPVQFNILTKGEFQIKEGYLGLVVSASPTREVIPFVQSADDFEYRLSSLIRKLTTTETKKVSFLTGHGEKYAAGSYRIFAGELSKNYTIEEFDSADASSVAPLAGTALIVSGPEQALSKEEEARIDGFLKNSGRALLLLDGVQFDQQSLSAAPWSATSPAAFALNYGVKINPDMVYDLRSNENVSFGGGFVSVVLPYPFWARVLPASDSPITKNIPSVVLPWTSSLEVDKDRIGQASVQELLRATQFAGAQKDSFSLRPDQRFAVNEGDLRTRLVGVALSDLDVGGSDKKTRIVVVGSSKFLEDAIARNKPENIAFGMNAVDWLIEDESLLAIRSKSATPKPLVFASDRQKEMIKYANLAGVPGLILAAGFVVLFRRHRLTKRAWDETV